MPLPRIERYEKPYVIGRVAATVLIAVCTGWAVVAYSDMVRLTPAVVGAVLFAATTIAQMAARAYLRAGDETILAWSAPADFVAVVLLGVAFRSFGDPAYPLLVALPIFYVLLLKRRGAWLSGLAAAAAYLLIHFGDTGLTPLGVTFAVAKAALVVYVALVTSLSASRFMEREAEIRHSTDEKERLNGQLQRRLAELQAVSQITEVIHSSLDFDRVGPLVLEILTKVIDIPACCLFVIDRGKADTMFSASVGVAEVRTPRLPKGDIFTGVEAGEEHFTCSAILDHHQMMVVFCAPNDALEGMSDEDRLVLQAVSSELVVAVENSQLYKLTKRLAITDELTSLYNYRYLQQRLDEEIERARRYGKDLSLLMLDADDFKRFNDTNGHIAGDAALAELATVVRCSVREVDVVCRYGGEEFSVLLPETDAAGAFVVAEKIREAIASHPYENGAGERAEQITVSIGLASFPSHAKDKESLLRQADDALYTAKKGGKDRVRSPRSIRRQVAETATDTTGVDR